MKEKKVSMSSLLLLSNWEDNMSYRFYVKKGKFWSGDYHTNIEPKHIVEYIMKHIDDAPYDVDAGKSLGVCRRPVEEDVTGQCRSLHIHYKENDGNTTLVQNKFSRDALVRLAMYILTELDV